MIAFHKAHGGEASLLEEPLAEELVYNRLCQIIESMRKKSPVKLASGAHIVGNVLVDETAKIEEGCLIGPDVAIGPGCVVEAGVRLSLCTVMRGVRIKKHACISSSIIGYIPPLLYSGLRNKHHSERVFMLVMKFTAMEVLFYPTQ
ncbi:hypothetical protein Leryth_009791 [Lithospermum erythrorhizon]|nr:hypothetical protein Leryth_009791 [Lithospermum erythrorhizon]